MAAVHVSAWAVSGSLLNHIVGDILYSRCSTQTASPLYITPQSRQRPVNGFRDGYTMWRAGVQMVQMAGAPSPTDGLTAIYAELFDIVTNAVPQSICWDGGRCELILLCLVGADTSVQRQSMRHHLGVPHLEWLPYAEVKYVLTWNGPPAMSLPASITAPGILLHDVLTWTHIRTGRIVFHKQRPVSDDAARCLIVALLTNFPELVFAPSLGDELCIAAEPWDHPLCVRTTGTRVTADAKVPLRISGTGQGDGVVVYVASSSDAVRSLHDYVGDEAKIRDIYPHPSLNRLVCLWQCKRRWQRSRHAYKSAVLAATTRHGKQDVAGRQQAWRNAHPGIAAALEQVSWKSLRQIVGATGWGEQVLYRYRLKQRAFSRWDVTQNKAGCPISILRYMGSVGDCSTSRLDATFRLKLEHVPPSLWTLLEDTHKNDTEDGRNAVRGYLYEILNDCWRVGAIETLQAIWRRRCLYRDPNEDTSPYRAAAVLHGRLRTAYLTVRAHCTTHAAGPHQVAAAKLCYLALTTPGPATQALPSPTRQRQHLILYFDGGSRGNPGPGGSGSAIVQVGGTDPSPKIVWLASISSASKTTNNIAEYRGLLVGLRYAVRATLHGIHVVGDSHLIITQLRERRFPRSRHLQGLYTQCRTLADRLMVRSWTHHLRHLNKMADALANIVMDSKTSKQVFAADVPDLPQNWSSVVTFLQGTWTTG